MSLILGTTSLHRSDFYNEIIIQYAYDYDNETFSKVYIYPESDALNYSYQLYNRKRSIVIKMPIHYSDSDVQKWAELYYGQWAFGVFMAETEANLGDIDSYWFYPQMGSEIIHGLSFTINKKQLLINQNKTRLYLSGWNNEGDHANFWDQ